MDTARIEQVITNMPSTPGVYRYYDVSGNLLYVGKAVNLKRRVSSYFKDSQALSPRIRLMVSKIADIQYVVVGSESEALLLENNFIKELNPKYNVLLKDDKTYPWITIKNERFPRVQFDRNPNKTKNIECFGPYTNVWIVKGILEMLKEIYPLRSCTLNLSKEAIESNKYKTCLAYHIKKCQGPCIGEQTEEDYLDSIEQIRQVLKGNVSQVLSLLKYKMNSFAENYEFEKAEVIKRQIEGLYKFKQKSVVVNPAIHNVDVFSIIDDENKAYVNFLKVVNGAIVQSHSVVLVKKMDETVEDLLLFAIVQLRTRFQSSSNEIIVPIQVSDILEDVHFVVPKIGDKHKLLLLSEGNVRQFRSESLKNDELKDSGKKYQRILERMKSDLRLKELPIHIECFDNSNIQGTSPVSSCVVFKNAKPARSEYRKFNVKTVIGANDFATMQEVVYRRYSRLLKESKPLPQLVVVDGGKGQLGAVIQTFDELGLRGKVAVIGIAKRLEEIYFPGDSIPIYIDKHSETLKVIQQLRDEAHRFGITFHRDKRSKSMIKSELDDIPGIGAVMKTKLLTQLGSVSVIRNASYERLSEIVGPKRASIIKDYFATHNP